MLELVWRQTERDSKVNKTKRVNQLINNLISATHPYQILITFTNGLSTRLNIQT